MAVFNTLERRRKIGRARRLCQRSGEILGEHSTPGRVRARGALLLGLLILIAPGICLGQALPGAPGATVTTITPDPGFFTEPSVAINPNHPDQVVAVYQDNAHAAYSTDAGKNWTVATGVAPSDYRVSGDVSVAYDNQGHALICYIAFDKLGTFNYWGHNANRNGIYVRRSLDGGKNWEANDIAVSAQPQEPGIPFEDKPYIVADNGHGPFAGNLYIGWTRWTLTNSELLFVRSTDDGKSWSKPMEIDNRPGLPRDDNGALEGFAAAVGPDGTVHVLWADGNHIVLTTSHDGGQTFSPPRNIIDTSPIMFGVDAVERANGFPQIAIDPRGGGSGGPMYVTWSDYRNGDVDVFCSTSADHGGRWSPARRVNTDPQHDGADQFFQWMTVDPADGAVYAVFYDRRGDPENRKQIVTLARSTDGGTTFQNYAWNAQPFDAQGVFLGDYTGIAAFDGRVYGVWTEKPAPPSSNGPPQMQTPDRRAYWRQHGTIVQIGVADFAGTR